MNSETKKKLFKVAITSIVAFGALGFAISMSPKPSAVQTIDHSQFDSDRWKKNSDHDRERCVSNLIDRRLLIGLSKQQVQHLLGPSESNESPDYFDYDIPPDNASFETLFVFFKNDKVSKCELRSNP
jgi:hypothetical protein